MTEKEEEIAAENSEAQEKAEEVAEGKLDPHEVVKELEEKWNG